MTTAAPVRPRAPDRIRLDLVRARARIARLRRSPRAVELLCPDSFESAELRRLLMSLGQLRTELRTASGTWPGCP